MKDEEIIKGEKEACWWEIHFWCSDEERSNGFEADFGNNLHAFFLKTKKTKQFQEEMEVYVEIKEYMKRFFDAYFDHKYLKSF